MRKELEKQIKEIYVLIKMELLELFQTDIREFIGKSTLKIKEEIEKDLKVAIKNGS
jgi:hypothetical protein